MSTLAERAVARTPRRPAFRFGGMSDRAIAWLFITPSVLLLLAINIFPLIWTIQLSFTNYRANRPNAPLRCAMLVSTLTIRSMHSQRAAVDRKSRLSAKFRITTAPVSRIRRSLSRTSVCRQ